MDVFYGIVGTIGALGLLAFMAFYPYLLNNTRTSSNNVEYVSIEPYTEYETADRINSRWGDEERIGRCEYCGMDDCPIVLRHPVLDADEWGISMGGPKCKWCAERDNLHYHLTQNGVRRFKMLISGRRFI